MTRKTRATRNTHSKAVHTHVHKLRPGPVEQVVDALAELNRVSSDDFVDFIKHGVQARTASTRPGQHTRRRGHTPIHGLHSKCAPFGRIQRLQKHHAGAHDFLLLLQLGVLGTEVGADDRDGDGKHQNAQQTCHRGDDAAGRRNGHVVTVPATRNTAFVNKSTTGDGGGRGRRCTHPTVVMVTMHHQKLAGMD